MTSPPHATDALCAAALADTTGAGISSLLSRVKYADGTQHKLFESGSANLTQLLRIWTVRMIEKDRERKWVKIGNAWMGRSPRRSIAGWPSAR